jgi:hypothetical protein
MFFAMGQVLGFFQMNLRYIHPWWENKPLVTTFVFSIPIGLLFYHGWGHMMSASGSAWTARFVGFGVSYLIFPFLVYWFLGEPFLSLKNFLCFFLSLLIILIQFYVK